MADKKIRFKNASGNYYYPITKLSHVLITVGTGISVNGETLAATVAVAGTTATATAGVVKPSSTYFSTDANGFLTPKAATTSALGVAKFSSTYFTVSNGNVTPKAATESAKGVVELATNAEAAAGTDTSRAVTPKGLKTALDGFTIDFTKLSDAAVDSESVSSYPYADYIMLVFDKQNGKWRPSNWLQRLITFFGSTISQIGVPFDGNDMWSNSNND